MDAINEFPLGTRLDVLFTEESGNVVSGVAERVVATAPELGNRLLWRIDTGNGIFNSWDSNVGFKPVGKLPSARISTNRLAFIPSLHAQAKSDESRRQFLWRSKFNEFSFDDDDAFMKLRSDDKKNDGHVYEIFKGKYLIVPLGQQNISKAGSLHDRRISVTLTNFNLKFVKGLSSNDDITAHMISLIGTKQVLDGGNFDSRNSFGIAVGQVRYTNMKVPVAVFAILAAESPETSFFTYLALVSELEPNSSTPSTYLIPHTSFIPTGQESNFALFPSHLFVVSTIEATALIEKGLTFLDAATVKDDDVVFKLPRASSSSSAAVCKDHFSSDCKTGRKSIAKTNGDKKVLRPTKPKAETPIQKKSKVSSSASLAPRSVVDLSNEGGELVGQGSKVATKPKKNVNSAVTEERPAKIQVIETSVASDFEDNFDFYGQRERPNYRQDTEEALTSNANILAMAKGQAISEQKAKNLELLLEHQWKTSEALLRQKDESYQQGKASWEAAISREDLHYKRSLENRDFFSNFAFKAVEACQNPSSTGEARLKSSNVTFLNSSSKREFNCEENEGSDKLFELGSKKLKASEALTIKAGFMEGEQAAALLKRANELKLESESHTKAAIARMEEEYLK